MKSTFDEIRRGFLRGMGFFAAVLLGSAITYTAANVPNTFSSGQIVSASALNANFAALQSDVAVLTTGTAKIAPIGTILAWHKDQAGGTPALPAGWLECNGQTVSDPDSPYNGQALPNLNSPLNAWNSRGVFLRGHTTSGLFENDQLQAHRHGAALRRGVFADALGAMNNAVVDTDAGLVGGVTNEPGFGTVRAGQETRAVNMSVVWIMRIK